MEDGFTGVVDPVFVSQVVAANPQVHAANGDVAQAFRRFTDLRRHFIAHKTNQFRQHKGADHPFITVLPSICEGNNALIGIYFTHFSPGLDPAFDMRQEPVHQCLETAL